MGQEHPTIAQARAATPLGDPVNLSSDWLHALCVECSADDAAFVNMDHPDIQDQRSNISEVPGWILQRRAGASNRSDCSGNPIVQGHRQSWPRRPLPL